MPKDTHCTITDHAQLEFPEQVTLAIAELAGAAREGLLALAVGTGLQVLQALMAENVARVVGPTGRHHPQRTAVRHGSEPGQVTLGGRRVRIRRPRVRSADGTREVPVPTYQAFPATDLLGELALERMLAKLSRAAIRLSWNPSAPRSNPGEQGPPGRRSRVGSWPEPSMPWPTCWPPT